MAPLRVVEALDVIGDAGRGGGAGGEELEVDELSLDGREEALGDRVDAPMASVKGPQGGDRSFSAPSLNPAPWLKR